MCVCVGGGGGGGGGAIPCETVEMTRDCCEKDPFKSVLCCRFPFRRSYKKTGKAQRKEQETRYFCWQTGCLTVLSASLKTLT